MQQTSEIILGNVKLSIMTLDFDISRERQKNRYVLIQIMRKSTIENLLLKNWRQP